MLKTIFNKDFSKYNILIFGDAILDQYYNGEVTRISSEAPIPINRITTIENKLGGAANVAANLRALNVNITLVTHIGNDNNGIILENNLHNIKVISCKSNHPTTTKIRITSKHQQMLRLDFEDKLTLSTDQKSLLKKQILKELNCQHAVIISDYSKGFCSDDICQFLIQECNKLNIPIIIDPKGDNWEKYNHASFITPNLNEFNAILDRNVKNDEDIVEKALATISKYDLTGLLVTRSEKGLSIITKDKMHHIPANNLKSVYDVTGAGDSVIAIFTLIYTITNDYYIAARLANITAGIVVSKNGTYAPTQEEILAVL